MTDTNEEVEFETVPVPRVGEQLRAVREEKKLTIVEVASQLRLVRGNIELLEQGNWGQLHGRAYARGYFTSYVKFLGLPEEEMLEAFNAEYSATVEEPKLNAGGEKKRRTPLIYTLVFLTLILLAWISYPQWSHYFDTDRELFKNTEQTQTSVKNEQPEMMTETNPSEEAEIQSVIEPIEAVEKNDTEVSEQVSGDAVQQSNIKNQVLVAEEVDKVQSQSEELLSQPSVESVSNEKSDEIRAGLADNAVQPEMEQVEQAVEQNQLSVELHFSDDCWIKITDADGKTLLNKIMPANSQQTVTGKPPFNFSLGRSSTVSMKVNGQDFDMTPYQKREVVHFTVEQPVS